MMASAVQQALVWWLPLLMAVVLHEVAHGYCARRLGDPTAAEAGRLTLNPLRHLDPVGSVLVPLLLWWFTPYVFGWARPVPVDPRRLRRPRQSLALVAAAGPAANVALALGWAVAWRIATQAGAAAPLQWMCLAGMQINCMLALINLLPVPPLDGSRVAAGVLPARWLERLRPLALPALLTLLGLLFFGGLDAIIIDLVARATIALQQLVSVP